MLHNRLLRTIVSVVMFTRVLGSYVWFGFITSTFTKDKKKLRKKLAALHEKNAHRVYVAFARLKGVYIKVGQFLSTQAMLPPQYLAEMAKMQDRVPTASTEKIHARINEMYGTHVDEIFAEFSEEPLACASIGQVHRVKLKDGRDAVLKVKYPEIDKSFHDDLDLLKVMVPLFVRTIEYAFYREKTGINHKATISEFVKYIRMELDYTNEIYNHRKMYEIMSQRDDVVVPQIYLDLCTPATICMEYIDAWKINDFFSSREISDEHKDAAYAILVDAMLFQVSKFGFFQADTHPGNFLLKYDGEKVIVVMLDFGCSKQLPNEFRHGILKSFQGYINRDAQLSAQAYYEMGFRTKNGTTESLERWAVFVFGIITQVIEIFEKRDSLTDFVKLNAVSLSEQGLELAQSDRIDYVPEEYIMFGRALATPPIPFDQFQPKADLLGLAMPHIANFTMPQGEVHLDEATLYQPD